MEQKQKEEGETLKVTFSETGKVYINPSDAVRDYANSEKQIALCIHRATGHGKRAF